MNRRYLLAIALTAIATSTGASIAQTPSDPAPKPAGNSQPEVPKLAGGKATTLKFGSDPAKANAAVAGIAQILIPEIESRLKQGGISGKINTAEKYGLSGSGNIRAFLAVGGGEFDMGLVDLRAEASTIPLLHAPFHAPFIGLDQPALDMVLSKVLDQSPELRQSFLAKNLVLLALVSSSEYVLVTKSAVNTFAQLKGRRIGVPAVAAGWLQNTGAKPVISADNTLASGLKSGKLDGAIVPIANIVSLQVHKIAPFVTRAGLGVMPTLALTFNKQRWDNLSAPIRDAIFSAAEAYQNKIAANGKVDVTRIDQALKAAGASVTEMNSAEREKWAHRLPDVAKEWMVTVKKMHQPSTRVMEVYLAAAAAIGNTGVRRWTASPGKSNAKQSTKPESKPSAQ